MIKHLISGLFLMSSMAWAAVPTLNITAPVEELKKDAVTTVTFTFPEPVTGFTLSDAHILASGQFVQSDNTTPATVLDGSGAVYTVKFKKLLNQDPVSIMVDNKSFTAVSDSSLGVGDAIGFNGSPKIFVKTGGLIGGKTIPAVPQPRCPKAGEMLVDSVGAPSTAAVEDYYILRNQSDRKYINYIKIDQGCLVRLVGGQSFVKKTTPKDYEVRNVQGAHNHSTLMPKANMYQVKPVSGTNKVRVKARNADCNPDGTGRFECGNEGDFRITANAVRIDNDDPIVYPGIQGAAHMHTFFGNTSVNYNSTLASLLNSSKTTLTGGKANGSAYWMPSVIDTAIEMARLPDGILIYYKAGESEYAPFIEPVPQGLVLIAGNSAAKTLAEKTDTTSFTCYSESRVGAVDISNDNINHDGIPACSGNDYGLIRIGVAFPNCIADDGTGKMKLDSPDHRSHAQPPNYHHSHPIQYNGCTADFPHRITKISQGSDYFLKRGENTATWRLSSDNYSSSLPGGYSNHADYLVAWQVYWMNRITAQCNRIPFNCGTNSVGLHDGIPILSITTSGNIATVTTAPHKLNLGNEGLYADNIRVRISGVTGVDAAAYNFDPSKVITSHVPENPTALAPVGQARSTILNGTQISFPLNYTPVDTTVNVSAAIIQWEETFCGWDEAERDCPQAYSDFYYGDKE